MIRIDEIYNHTFWPWIKHHCPGMRMYYCDPPGHTDKDSLYNFGRTDLPEMDYVFFHDQEPVDLNLYRPLFNEVLVRVHDIVYSVNEKNNDSTYGLCFRTNEKAIQKLYLQYLLVGKLSSPKAHCIVSEQGDHVRNLSKTFHWQPHYYFYHGWAALDWYRGYHRTFLMPQPQQRKITRTFIAPNRIIAGTRQHRLLMLYHIFKRGMINNWISCPAVCPAEKISAIEAAAQLRHIYPDIESVFAAQSLPFEFPNETGAPMHSCWLSLFNESAESLLYLVTETIATGERLHLTEKTFKPICLGMPFVMVGTKHSLRYLRSYGFQTFSSVWDESYDDEPDDVTRLERITDLLWRLDQLPQTSKQQLFDKCLPIIQHNYNHFYGGAFEQILWNELQGMLDGLKSHR